MLVVWWCFGGVFVVVFLQRLSSNIAQSSTEVMAVSSNIAQSSTEVMAATHVRTTDAGKVVELSVTRHHTGSLVWLMRKFSVWNFHGSKVYARDKKH